MQTTFQGYRRENGRVGVRNHVIILPVDDLSNAACEAVAHNIKGALAIPHPYGRLQFGADLDLHFRTLIGTGSNPNVAAVVVIGIEDQWTKKVVDGIAATGKPVTGFGIELHGDHDTIMRASKAAKEYVQWASELQRVELRRQGALGLDQVRRVGHDVGLRLESDGRRRVRQAVRGGRDARVRRDDRADRRRADRRRALPRRQGPRRVHAGVRSLSGGHQPPQDERPLRLAADQGQHRRRTHDDRGEGARQHPEDRQASAVVDGVLDKAEAPTGPGLWFMDSSSAAAEMVTLCAAAGYVVHFFPTGQGNVIGNPILPVIKLCANPRTVRTMSEHVDVDTSGLLQRAITMSEAGDKLLDMMFRTANGRLTAAEALGHREFVLTRLYESA